VKARSVHTGYAVTLRQAASMQSAGTMMAPRTSPKPYKAPSGWKLRDEARPLRSVGATSSARPGPCFGE